MTAKRIIDADTRADFLARLEYGVSPVVGSWRKRGQGVAGRTVSWEDESGSERCANTIPSLAPPALDRKDVAQW